MTAVASISKHLMAVIKSYGLSDTKLQEKLYSRLLREEMVT